MTNCHSLALRVLVLHDDVPMSKDKKHVSVVLHHPEDLAELELSRPRSQVFG